MSCQSYVWAGGGIFSLSFLDLFFCRENVSTEKKSRSETVENRRRSNVENPKGNSTVSQKKTTRRVTRENTPAPFLMRFNLTFTFYYECLCAPTLIST